MKFRTKSVKVLSAVLALVMICTQFAFALPQPEQSGEYTSGKFVYTQEKDNPVEDVYVYSDKWFDVPSTTVLNKHLKTLSLVAAMSSGKVGNVKSFLSGIGFSDISVNKYFVSDIKEPFSMGCAVASKAIVSNGQEYTLLAIVPRSYDYGSEWVSNFTVGDTRTEDMHVGFKSARDEILRLVQQHAAEYGITGPVKVWVAGHSRGAAVSNLVAGFLVDYPSWIGSGVTLTPDDMYGFTFGTPQGARNSMDSSCVSVVAASDDANATAGGGTAAGYQGTIIPSDSRFDCIRNFVDYVEPNTYIVPNDLSFTKYGQELTVVDSQPECKDLMEMYLANAYPYLRSLPFYGADPALFVGAPGMFDDQAEFMSSRLDMLEQAIIGLENQNLSGAERSAAFGKSYIEEGYQKTFQQIFELVFDPSVNFDLDTVLPLLNDYMDDALQTALSIFVNYLMEKQEYYVDHSDAEDKANALGSLLAQLKLINLALDASNPSNYRSSVIPMLDGLLQNADLPINLSGEIIADAIFNYTSLLMDDEVLPEAVAEGAAYAVDHAREITVSKTQALLSVVLSMLDSASQAKYQYLATEQAARTVARILGYVLFGNYVEEPTVSLLKISIVMVPAFSMSASFNMDQPEIVTAKTFSQNFRSLGTAHVHCDMLSWLRADDSCYIIADLPEGRYKTHQVVHLYTADGAEIHYTTDGSTPTAESTLYNPEIGILLRCSNTVQEYSLKAITVSNGETGPVWTYGYSFDAIKAVPKATPTDIFAQVVKTDNMATIDGGNGNDPLISGSPDNNFQPNEIQQEVPKQSGPDDPQTAVINQGNPSQDSKEELTASTISGVNWIIVAAIAAVVIIAAVIMSARKKNKGSK